MPLTLADSLSPTKASSAVPILNSGHDSMDDVTLILGDCLEWLPKLPHVDAVVTDPPYGIKHVRGQSKYIGKAKWATRFHGTPIIGDDRPFDPAPFLAFPVVVMFGANHFADKLPPSRGWVFWDKRGNFDSTDFADGELIYSNQDHVVRKTEHRWRGVIRDSENGDLHLHPTQKPVELMVWLIEQYTHPGDLVLDPFMGSGTTGVACVRTGRRFIGIEMREPYFETARRRIAEAQLQAPLFPHGEAEPKPTQGVLW